ncbi:MAG: aldehyde ferredoxin oxidoreductase family protein [Clostridia bacterium]|jgi:aldehyde:ferredoxin oxidoreductase
MKGGYWGRVLRINLGDGRVWEEAPNEALYRQYIGGSGVGARFLYDLTGGDTDPLGPENPLIFMTGPFAGTPVPTSGRYQIIAKSPLTGIYGEGDSGGTWGPGLKRCGYDGIVIEGTSEKPVYILVREDGAKIIDASFLWGRDTYETDEMLKGIHGDNITVACIGPAGERLIKLASIMNDGSHARAVGRTGLGAVMGSKRLKAVVVSGSLQVPVADQEGLKRSIKAAVPTMVQKTIAMKQHGTAAGTVATEKIGDFPLKNWSGSVWNKVENVSGQRMTDTILTGRYFCEACIIGCGREVEIKEGPYAMKGAGPEYEAIGMLGGMCLIDNLEAIAYGGELCNRYGLDIISTGGAIAFAMELYEQGIITKEDTGGLDLVWGNADAMIEIINRIVNGEGLGGLLGDGVREAARRIGGRAPDFAIHTKGLELPAHDPRAFNSIALGYATSNRGACHLQGASHMFEKSVVMPELGIPEPKDRFRKDDQGEFMKTCQDLMCILDSLKVCKFTLYAGLHTTHIREWLKCVTGWDISLEELMAAGERIFSLKRMYNVKCGIRRSDDTIPERILKQPRTEGGAKDNLPPLESMLEEYYPARGWDENGVPLKGTIEKLGLEWDL